MDEAEDIVDCMTRMRGDRQAFAVATVVRTEDATAAKAGAKAVIRADGTVIGWIGGGCAVGAARKAAAQALLDGKARLIRVRPQARAAEDALPGVEYYLNSCASGGVVELFIEPVLPKPALVIVGASPTAHALADLGRRLGFAVHVAALKEDLAGFEAADGRFEGFEIATLPRIAESFIVVATQGKRDREALAGALASPALHIAFVGSRRKAAVLIDALVAGGLDRAALARLKAPAGLDIGAATPEEISLSILAEIVQLRRRGAAAGEVSGEKCEHAKNPTPPGVEMNIPPDPSCKSAADL
jgi:xanthine dehydrogenase accessory factor